MSEHMQREFKGSCQGVRLEPRGADEHIMVRLMTEDDGHWSDSGHAFSSYWISDLITQLMVARAAMRTHATKSPDGYGYAFADKPERTPKGEPTKT